MQRSRLCSAITYYNFPFTLSRGKTVNAYFYEG